ncbi:hypothetical protein [Paraburkholderia phosphatilytica]|uniref:hypothetical protein n=1 Tax=Paraburkholderia phosphatilytica TaxID=2282883 RepID=UPI00197D0756|nr:hypothetical protein [Paraburkholderia phosphatilytica]
MVNRQRQNAAVLATGMICCIGMNAMHAQETDKPVVRVAELMIDPANLDAYKAAVKEEMD